MKNLQGVYIYIINYYTLFIYYLIIIYINYNNVNNNKQRQIKRFFSSISFLHILCFYNLKCAKIFR